MQISRVALLCSIACFSLACVSTGGPPGYSPPAWKEPGLTPFLYGLTRKAITAARGPYPQLIIRIDGGQSQGLSLLWAQIPAAVSKKQKYDELPFLPIPNLRIPLPPELENCSDFEVFVNPTPEDPNPVNSDIDTVVAPLSRDQLAPIFKGDCAIVVFYGAFPERDGAWLEIALNQDVLTEQMIVKARPGFWALVPLAAIGDTAICAVATATVALVFFVTSGAPFGQI